MGTKIPAAGGSGGGQDPAAVQITGGAITGVSLYGDAAATWTARASYLDSFERFKRSVYAAMISGDPTLTAFEYLNLATMPLGATVGAVTNDANIEGGGLACPAGGAGLAFTGSVFQNQQLGHWALFWEGKSTPGATGQVTAGNATAGAWIGSVATDSTHFFMRIFDSGGTTDLALNVGDTSNHIFGIVDNGTHLSAFVDGVLVGTQTDRSRLHAQASQIYTFGPAAGNAKVRRIAWGYIPL